MQDHHTLSPEKIDRFWSLVDKSGGPDACWPWKLAPDFWGYGKFTYDGRRSVRKSYRAHRFAYIVTFGIEDDSLFVCHRCDFRMCCNPAHLFLGTALDNTRDCMAKGRMNVTHKFGKDHYLAKVDEDKVKAIISMRDKGMSITKIACEFGIKDATVSSIVRGLTWKHVTGRSVETHGGNYSPSKISDDAAALILRWYIPGDKEFGQGPLAKRFGMSRTGVSSIITGRNRKAIHR